MERKSEEGLPGDFLDDCVDGASPQHCRDRLGRGGLVLKGEEGPVAVWLDVAQWFVAMLDSIPDMEDPMEDPIEGGSHFDAWHIPPALRGQARYSSSRTDSCNAARPVAACAQHEACEVSTAPEEPKEECWGWPIDREQNNGLYDDVGRLAQVHRDV